MGTQKLQVAILFGLFRHKELEIRNSLEKKLQSISQYSAWTVRGFASDYRAQRGFSFTGPVSCKPVGYKPEVTTRELSM